MTIPLQPSFVYGPVRSRRLGVSLGINLLPDNTKFCNFDCVYCQYGWTDFKSMKKSAIPKADVILEALEKDFSARALRKEKIDSITLSGNGEPTLHPEIEKVIEGCCKLRDRYLPKARLSILSNSSLVYRPAVQRALAKLDDRYMKLDAGTYETFCKIDGHFPKRNWEKIIEGLKKLSPLTVQTLFLKAPVDNTVEEELRAWLGLLVEIEPKEVHVYSLDRPPADSKAQAVPRETLEVIARQVRRLGIPAKVF